MEEKITKYLATKAVQDFKVGVLKPELCHLLSKGEFSRYYRELITEDDKQWLYEKLFHTNEYQRIFAGVIIRPIINLYKIDELFSYWNNCTNAIEKDYFVYDLADYKNLSEEQHRILFKYIKENLDVFIKSKKDYLRDDLALNELKTKIKGTTVHPITKKWVYWINILSYIDVISGKELIEFLNEIDTCSVDHISESFYFEVKEFLFNKLSLI